MNKEFVPYDIALAMKELGFDEPCLASWSYTYELQQHIEFKLGYIIDGPRNYTNAPLYQQAFEWFRIEHNLDAEIYMNNSIIDNGKFYTFAILRLDGGIVNYVAYAEDRLDTYDIARDACIKKLTELVKEK